MLRDQLKRQQFVSGSITNMSDMGTPQHRNNFQQNVNQPQMFSSNHTNNTSLDGTQGQGSLVPGGSIIWNNNPNYRPSRNAGIPMGSAVH